MNKNLDIQCTSGYCLFRLEIQENAVSSVTGYFHKFKPDLIDPFHVYVNEVELEDKTITRSDV